MEEHHNKQNINRCNAKKPKKMVKPSESAEKIKLVKKI